MVVSWGCLGNDKKLYRHVAYNLNKSFQEIGTAHGTHFPIVHYLKQCLWIEHVSQIFSRTFTAAMALS